MQISQRFQKALPLQPGKHPPGWQSSFQNQADKILRENGLPGHPHPESRELSGNIYQSRTPSEAAYTAEVPEAVHRIFPYIFWKEQYNLWLPPEKRHTKSVSGFPQIPYPSFSGVKRQSPWSGIKCCPAPLRSANPDNDISDGHPL